MYSFNLDDIQQQVIQFMLQNGIVPYDQDMLISADGNIHRFRTRYDAQSETSGAYCIFSEHWPAGWVEDWRNGKGAINWSFSRDALNDEAQAFFSNKRYNEALQLARLHQQEALQLHKQKQIEASEQSRLHFDHSEPASQNHPYLKAKNLLVLGLHQIDDKLIVPLRDVNGHFMSLQWIDDQGNKKFYPNAPIKGAFYSVALDNLQPHMPILVAEGFGTMATIYELTGYPCVAAMNCHNLYPVAEALKAKFPENKILFLADNDFSTAGNPGITSAENACKKLHLHGVIFPEFNPHDDGSDWNDYRRIYGDDHTKVVLHKKIHYCCLPPDKQKLLDSVQLTNGNDLIRKSFKPIKWAVDGFLPSGCTILGGNPKAGKSILALHLALAVALGGMALGKIKVQQGDVLYLALEDGQRRLQERIFASNMLNNEKPDLSHLDFVHQIPRQHEGGIAFLRWWLQEHPNARLVIIDTLQIFRKPLSGKGHMYAEDYDAVSEIKKLADEFDVPILIIHHLKKAKEQSDWLNEFSGSQGIAGSADTLFALKRQRTDPRAILHRTGRDVEEKDFALRLDGFGWILEGDAELFTMPEWKRQILDYLKEHSSCTPMDLAQALNLNPATLRKNLLRLTQEGLIKKSGFGIYELKDK